MAVSKQILFGISAFLLFSTTVVKGQFSGQNIAEYQYGQIPTDDEMFSSLYDRLSIDYDYNELKLGLTLENYFSPYSERNYTAVNQLRLQYKSDNWDIKIGNFYETLGRGTLMRTYQVPGAVLEDIAFRSRAYFHRDFVGAFAKYQGKSWSVKAMAGQPLNNIFPPNQEYEQRRPDSLVVVGADYQIKSHKIEYNAMRWSSQLDEKWFSMFNVSGNINSVVSYYGELTFDNEGQVFDKDNVYAAYFNLNFSFDNLSITTEFKDYRNAVIGEAVNEPPALVKQHVYRVLNRSTHVPIPLDERGWQIEAIYYFPDESILTANYTLNVNDPFRKTYFKEYFVEYGRLIGDVFDTKIFFDYAQDEFKGESDRISTGFDVDILMAKRQSINVEVEAQTFDRFGTQQNNMLLSVGYNKGSKFTASVLTEYSSDDVIVEEGDNYKVWLGTNIKYKPNFKNTFLFFGGTRRGGPACTSGVCYEILDFEGVELRYTRRI